MMSASLRGIYAAAVTPFDSAGRPDYEQFLSHIRGLADDGCHGVLVSGTTGEGPSMNANEREELFRRSASAKDDVRLLAGTGSASIEDTVRLTRAAFDAGLDGAVILPPFFYRFPPLEGVYQFYATVIEQAVPANGSVLLYHNPAVSDVPITRVLIDQLRDRFPDQVVGIKDSSGDWDYNQMLCQIDPEFLVFVGSDALLSANLQAGGGGGITGLANVAPERLRRVYDLYGQGEDTDDAQTALNDAKLPLNDLPRIPAIKTWVRLKGIISNDEVRPPLSRLTEAEVEELRKRTGY
jgi:4-hydroxy-tetrahydrodipicolinate synthase